jgi:hypothetical protein
MYRKRLIEPTLKSALRTFPAVIITGARQSGKTTLLKHTLGGNYAYVLLDELDKRQFAQQDPKSFLDAYRPPIIIDEIQNVPSLLHYIKARIDEDNTNGRWVITGSQQFALMKNIGESLAGRAAILTLHPFAISESIPSLSKPFFSFDSYVNTLFSSRHKHVQSKSSLGAWLLRGNYPKLRMDKHVSARLWYASYLQTYLDRDVRGNIKETNLREFEQFLKLIASRTAQELHMASLSRELGISIPTVKSWISLLEASSLIFLLPPYHRNFGKRIIKAPKLYFMDTGLVSYLTGLQSEEHVLQSPIAGALFETAIVSNFKKMADLFSFHQSLYYWRAISGGEIDLLIDLNGTLLPIEIKLSSTITPHHTESIVAWRSLTRSHGHGLIISQSTDTGPIGHDIINNHWSLL